MEAKEMFEELGYELDNDFLDFYGERVLRYEKEYKDRTICIKFDKKCVSKFKIGLAVDFQDEFDLQITIKELQAINQQCKELGWIE